MDYSLKNKINSCITELYSIARDLESAANEVDGSITGMNTKKYTKKLYSCASKYRTAARELEKIK